jgi:hypothetical protein
VGPAAPLLVSRGEGVPCTREIPHSSQPKRVRRKGRAQSAPPMRKRSKLAKIRHPARCRSRTSSSSRSMQIDTWSLSDSAIPGPRGFPFFSGGCPLTPKFAGGKLAAPGPAASGQASRPGVSPQGRGGLKTLPAAPLRFRWGCPPAGLLQGDRGSMVREAGACSAGDCWL